MTVSALLKAGIGAWGKKNIAKRGWIGSKFKKTYALLCSFVKDGNDFNSYMFFTHKYLPKIGLDYWFKSSKIDVIFWETELYFNKVLYILGKCLFPAIEIQSF